MEYFHHLEEWKACVCKGCMYAIWPGKIQEHLKQKHGVAKAKGAKAAVEIRQKCDGIAEGPLEFVGPSSVPVEIPQLRMYRNGFKCRACQSIRSTREGIRKHCRQAHGQTEYAVRGQPSKAKQRKVDSQGKRLWDPVDRFQRFFPSREHSKFFQVQEQRGQRQQQEIPQSEEMHWTARVNGQLDKIWAQAAEIREQADRVIGVGETDEVNRWVERTKWDKYLQGFEHDALLDLMERPDAEEAVEDTIWTAMAGLAKHSQKTVALKAGLFVRFEAIRSEKQQTRYVPLRSYQDYKAIGTYTRPWQRVLMFFARTRKAEARKRAPRYRFTGHQEQAWVEFIREAKNQASTSVDEPKVAASRQRRRRRRTRDDVDDEESDPWQDTDQVELTTVQRACLRFCMALLDQRSIDHDYDSALVCALALLGVKEVGWKGVDQYPPILSRLIKVARFMVVQQAFEDVRPGGEFDGFEDNGRDYGSEDDEGYNSQIGDTREEDDWPFHDEEGDRTQRSEDDERFSEAKNGSQSVEVGARLGNRQGWIEAVGQMMDRFMVRGTGSPMQWMLDLRTYGLKIHYNTTSMGHIDWRDNEVLTYKGMDIRMDAFRGFVGTLLQQAQEMLGKRLLMGYEPPVIPWSHIRDDASNGRVRFNFLRDEHSRMPTDGEMWLRKKLGADVKQLKEWYQPETGEVDRAHMDQYMEAVKEFRMQLLVLMHITGGQPARAPEILSVRYENTAKGEHRNLFVEKGLVVFVTQYHKGYAMSGDVKIIHRYLPREVSELVVYYLWLVLPFNFAMESQYYRDRRPGREAGENGEEQAGEVEERCEHEPVSAHMWPTNFKGDKVTSARMREAMKRYSREHLGQTLTIQSYREVAIAISRKFMGDQEAFMKDFDEIDEDEPDEGEQGVGRRLQTIMDKQASHTSSVAGMIYARLISEQDGAVASMRERFRTVSCMWHLWLGFDSAFDRDESGDTQGRRKRKAVEMPWEAMMEAKQAARWKHLRGVDIQSGLQQMMRSTTARFRGVQREAIQAIVQGAPRIIAVMPTGEGKSLLFQLPAYVSPRGLTIVVVPLVALRHDMMIRCKAIGVVAREWEVGKQVDDASIVFVTPETAAQNGSFKSFADRNRRRLDRIVIDECHVVLNKSTTFRRHLQRLGGLVQMAAQIIMITATLPVSRVETLKKNMFWNGLEVREFRMRTARTNIRYSVCVIDGDRREHDTAVVRVVKAKFQQYRPGRMIVYCNSTTGVTKYAEMLGVDAYYSDADLKAEKFEDFRSGETQLIVATSALGLGIDIPNIRVVVHVDWPFGMIEYSQEGGRAGRDREASENIVIMHTRAAQGRAERGGGGSGQSEFLENTALIERFMQIDVPTERRTCRRIVLNEYFDGDVDKPCQQDEEACDVCEPSAELQHMIEGITATERDGVRQREVDDEGLAFETGVLSYQGVREVRVSQHEVREFRESQDDRQRAKEKEMEQRREEQTQTRQIQARLQEWRGKCVMCAIDGRNFRHSAWRCEHVQSCGAIVMARAAQKSTRLEGKFSCTICFAPQSMCSWFAPHPSKPGWYIPARTGTSKVCPFSGIILMAFACAIHSSEGQYHRRKWAADAATDGLQGEDMERQVMRPETWERRGEGPVARYMGREVRLNDESVSGWCIVFNNTIRRVEELQASRNGEMRARECP